MMWRVFVDRYRFRTIFSPWFQMSPYQAKVVFLLISISYIDNYFTILLQLHPTVASMVDLSILGGINLFTMQSASVYSVTTNFALAVDSVRTPNDMSLLSKADRSFFQLITPAPHR